MRILHFTFQILWLSLTGHCLAADLEWVRVADDNRSFVQETSGSKCVPWGFNYDHQECGGRLIEDYWDLYDHKKIHLPDNYHVPKNAPKESIHNSGELRAYAGIPARGPVSDETACNLIHGYHACVSYTDALIGKLLDELDRLELTEHTVVVLWGDHGWNLGEHTLWCKHSCYETSLQIPLIVRAPGIKGGQRRAGLIESIDVYPTLCELAGLSLSEHLQGRSFATLMKNPDTRWKSAAVGRYRNGDTIRTDQFRFTEYTNAKGQLTYRMLYDHGSDPGENVNVAAARTELIKELVGELYRRKGKDTE